MLTLYNTNIITASFHSIIMTILMTISELITGNLLGSIHSNFTIASMDMRHPAIILYFIIGKTLYFILLTLTMFFFKRKTVYNTRPDKSSFILIIISIISLGIMSTFYYICVKIHIPRQTELYIIVSSFCIIIINLLVVWLFEYTRNKHEQILQLQLELQMESDAAQYNKILFQQDEEQKILIHDIKKHLQAIHTLNENKDYEEINEYIEHLLGTPSFRHSFHPARNKHLNLLLSRYIVLCETDGIDLKIDAQNTDIGFMTTEDITTLFCNLFDNAIEAASSLAHGIIEFKIADKAETHITVISLINSCKRMPVRTAVNQFQSTKPDRRWHGIGMRSIEKIVTKYNGTLNTYYKEDDKTF